MTMVEKHQVIKRTCPLSSETIRGHLSVTVKSTIQYGPETTALVSVLNTLGAVSAVASSVEVIKEKVKALPLAHFDETGVRVDKGLRWAHVACNRDYAYISVEKKRGYDGMEWSPPGYFPVSEG
ncbi:transposase [Dethiosulfovibrio peptidovorans]